MANNAFGDEIIDCRLLGPLLRVSVVMMMNDDDDFGLCAVTR